jgi:hypothetical protein
MLMHKWRSFEELGSHAEREGFLIWTQRWQMAQIGRER